MFSDWKKNMSTYTRKGKKYLSVHQTSDWDFEFSLNHREQEVGQEKVGHERHTVINGGAFHGSCGQRAKKQQCQ